MSRNTPEELIRFVAGQLVNHPEAIRTRSSDLDPGLKVHLSVHEDDRGKVIGKNGRTARALRSLIRAAGAVVNRRYQLEIEDS